MPHNHKSAAIESAIVTSIYIYIFLKGGKTNMVKISFKITRKKSTRSLNEIQHDIDLKRQVGAKMFFYLKK